MSTVEAPYHRRISPNERLYLAGEKLAPPFAIQIVVEGRGAVDVEALRRAVATASMACPGARLVARGRWWVDSGLAPNVRVVDLDPQAVFEQASFLREPLDPIAGPTCEVLVVGGSRPTLVFRALHAVMDGKGALLWARDVMRCMRDEAAQGATGTESDLEMVRRLGEHGRRPALRFDHSSPLDVAGVDDRAFLWKRRSLAGAHVGLVAKIAAIVAARSGEERLRFMVPVDLRRHDPSVQSTANLSLPILLDVAGGGLESWDVLHARLLAALGSRAELALDGAEGAVSTMPIWGLRSVVRLALRQQRRGGRYLGSGILSHLGRIDASDFSAKGFLATTVYSLPVHAPLAPLSLVAVECGDHVELTLSCPEGEGMEARADALLDAIDAELGQNDMRRWPGNRSAAGYRSEATLPQLLAAQAARSPDAIALVRDDVTTSHGELRARSLRVARALRGRGIGPGSIVGLLADRTEAAVAALLGVLEAGAAYLPIDPQYPVDRVAFMLADAGVAQCLVQESHAARLSESFQGEAIVLESIPHGDDTGVFAPVRAVRPSDLAYVIYTSGSTGRPKGVQIEHRHLVNYIDWATRAYGVDATTRFALFTSLSFDLSVTSIFVPLLAGGSVALFPEELTHLTLRRVLEGSGVNALKLTPTHLDLLARLDLNPVGFRTIVVGGEQLRGAVAARAQTAFGVGCRIVNEYGPTETTVGCVTHVFDPARDAEAGAVPIGLPASNVRIHLLDRDQRAVDRGAPGEVYIAGDGVARGYLGRDDLNRERFVSLFDGERAYRTGDLARLNDAGLLEFLGRNDDQIKVRGHRIEPGEIEAALERHPHVERAVVLGRSRQGDPADKVLCAYVVPRAGLEEDDLRAFLAARLPAAMVPTFFVRVASVPLTTNGKVDARALPDPLATARSGATGGVRTGKEADVARIWAVVLGIDAASLGPDDDFNRLGGDSLQMVEMLSRVATSLLGSGAESAFMRDAHALLRAPTLAAVGRAVEGAQSLRGAPTGRVA